MITGFRPKKLQEVVDFNFHHWQHSPHSGWPQPQLPLNPKELITIS
jgi:hypothetical protein